VNMRTIIRLVLVGLLGAAVALLVSCGSSGTGLIPAADAGPLQSDFEAVVQAASSGNGDCAATESALGKTEQDFLALPASVDRGLHARLRAGIANLRKRALAMCIQPTPSSTATTSTPTETTSTTETTEATPPPTSTQTTPVEPSPEKEEEKEEGGGGGTEAPREGEAPPSESESNAGGASPGGAR
jgi:hypothetical protein